MAISGKMLVIRQTSSSPHMNTTQRSLIMQRWDVLQYDLIPELRLEHGALTPKLEKLVHILDWVRIEEWPVLTWQGIGRKPHERSGLANAAATAWRPWSQRPPSRGGLAAGRGRAAAAAAGGGGVTLIAGFMAGDAGSGRLR